MIHFKTYSLVSALPTSWDDLDCTDVFLKTPFLGALEQSSPQNISTYYVGVFNSKTLVGKAIVQRVELYTNDVFRKRSKHPLKQLAKYLISKIVKGNALIVGSLMHTGQHGFYYDSNAIAQNIFLDTLYDAVLNLKEQVKTTFKKNVRIIAFKDYFETDSIHNHDDFFKAHNLYKVHVQPNMVLNSPKHWVTIENYVEDLHKKYKRRYKTALKKKDGLESRSLNLEDIKTLEKDIYSLYQNVSDGAQINSFKLEEHHFSALKEFLKDDFKLFGYFKDEVLVGFYTLIHNNKHLETYFLGYNPNLQHQHQMYLNMLYDMLTYGVTNNFEAVVYARTAMEIKSSVGAKPHQMYIYLTHTNSFLANTILKTIVKYMNPIREWEERHPFK